MRVRRVWEGRAMIESFHPPFRVASEKATTFIILLCRPTTLTCLPHRNPFLRPTATSRRNTSANSFPHSYFPPPKHFPCGARDDAAIHCTRRVQGDKCGCKGKITSAHKSQPCLSAVHKKQKTHCGLKREGAAVLSWGVGNKRSR